MSRSARNRTDAPYQFHAFEVSYFSAKVRPALRYKGVWYEERRADLPEIRARTGLGFIPIVVTPDGETWQDSTDIYRRLEARHPEPPLFPSGALQRVAAQLVELYSDEFALLPAMHYRWGSELADATARARFGAMLGSLDAGRRAADRMAKARFGVGASLEAGPAIEAHTHELLAALSSHFETHPYLLGARTSFADCALMGPLDGHFFCDLVSRRLLLETAVPVVGWIERCKFPSADRQGAWLAEDVLAPTLIDVLGVMGRDAAPMLLDLLRSFEAWADQRPAGSSEPPRSVGPCETALRGTPIRRATLAYTLYSVQQVLDLLHGLAAEGRARVTEVLAGTGWAELLAYAPRHRLRRDGFALVFDPGPSR